MRPWCNFGRGQDSARQTQPVKRVAAITDLPPQSAEPASSDAAAAAAPTLVMPRAPLVGGALRSMPSSTQGTMFGQFYSPFLTTQEVIRKRGPMPR
jgi:hypothetical protein